MMSDIFKLLRILVH